MLGVGVRQRGRPSNWEDSLTPTGWKSTCKPDCMVCVWGTPLYGPAGLTASMDRPTRCFHRNKNPLAPSVQHDKDPLFSPIF